MLFKAVWKASMTVSVALVVLVASTALASATASAAAFPHFDHVFLMVEENHNYQQIIGNPAAPEINALANDYGLATKYAA